MLLTGTSGNRSVRLKVPQVPSPPQFWAVWLLGTSSIYVADYSSRHPWSWLPGWGSWKVVLLGRFGFRSKPLHSWCHKTKNRFSLSTAAGAEPEHHKDIRYENKEHCGTHETTSSSRSDHNAWGPIAAFPALRAILGGYRGHSRPQSAPSQSLELSLCSQVASADLGCCEARTALRFYHRMKAHLSPSSLLARKTNSPPRATLSHHAVVTQLPQQLRAQRKPSLFDRAPEGLYLQVGTGRTPPTLLSKSAVQAKMPCHGMHGLLPYELHKQVLVVVEMQCPGSYT